LGKFGTRVFFCYFLHFTKEEKFVLRHHLVPVLPNTF
jgi:hypothetical protein